MIFIMPKEFMVPNDEDHEPELEEAMAQLNLEPLPATFGIIADDRVQDNQPNCFIKKKDRINYREIGSVEISVICCSLF